MTGEVADTVTAAAEARPREAAQLSLAVGDTHGHDVRTPEKPCRVPQPRDQGLWATVAHTRHLESGPSSTG